MSLAINLKRALFGLPGEHHHHIAVPAALAADATAKTAIGIMPFKGKISKAEFIPSAAVVGADTNTRTVYVKKADGTVIATLAFTNGVNAAALTAKEMTLTATTANLILTEDTVLYVESEKTGTGLALPLGTIRLTFTPK